LEEKGVPYRLVEVDVFASGGPPTEHLERHPFARIPAFDYDGFRLYEAGAISRYVDEVFPGPALQPDDPGRRALMNQVISVLDSYAYLPIARLSGTSSSNVSALQLRDASPTRHSSRRHYRARRPA
jgi:glutathione S-transferase